VGRTDSDEAAIAVSRSSGHPMVVPSCLLIVCVVPVLSASVPLPRNPGGARGQVEVSGC
jgi:hypothetical protein